MIATDPSSTLANARANAGLANVSSGSLDEAATGGDTLNFSLLALSARTAQSAWAQTPLAQRAKLLRRLRGLLVEQALPLARQIAELRRCSTAEALATEIHPLADAIRFLEKNLVSLLRPRRLGRDGRPVWLSGVDAEIRRESFGLVLLIGPGNYPLFLAAVHALQALAAGNAVWIKPAPGGVPLLNQFTQLVIRSGFRPGLLGLLPEDVASTRAAIAARPDKVIFTGSAETGRKILQQLAPQLTPATLELSGCDAAFVRDDADLDLAARALAFGITLNRGATCIAPRRVLVAERIHDALGQKLVAELRLREPLPMEFTTARWLPLVQEALAAGAKLIHGNLRPDQLTGPLLLAHAQPEMPLLQNDTFGPVMSLVPVAGDEAALLANARCPYALGASVFSRDAQVATELAIRIRAGSVIINDLIAPTADPRLPFGGTGESGFGVTRGAEGLLAMTFPKTIQLNRARQRRHYAPLDEAQTALFESLLNMTHGSSLSIRLSALRNLIRLGRKITTKPGSTVSEEPESPFHAS